jgi:ornithine decarboxylase
MRTGFNGFTSDATIEVTDEPMASLYGETVAPRRRATVIKLGK